MQLREERTPTEFQAEQKIRMCQHAFCLVMRRRDRTPPRKQEISKCAKCLPLPYACVRRCMLGCVRTLDYGVCKRLLFSDISFRDAAQNKERSTEKQGEEHRETRRGAQRNTCMQLWHKPSVGLNRMQYRAPGLVRNPAGLDISHTISRSRKSCNDARGRSG